MEDDDGQQQMNSADQFDNNGEDQQEDHGNGNEDGDDQAAYHAQQQNHDEEQEQDFDDQQGQQDANSGYDNQDNQQQQDDQNELSVGNFGSSVISAGSQLLSNEQQSKSMLDAFFEKYSGEVQTQFSEFAQQNSNGSAPFEDEQQNDEPMSGRSLSILARDLPLVMRVSFYHDNITFHATQTDKPELFNLPNSYKFIMDNLSTYFRRDVDPNEERVSYQDFVQFVYFFVLKNPTSVYLRQDNSGGADSQRNEIDAAMSSPLQRELIENIAKYEKILENPSISQQERIIAQKTIDSLKVQLNALLAANAGDKTSKSKTKIVPKNEIRLKNLREAFAFYSRQQAVTGTKFTFDRIVHEHNVVSLACFLLMLKQFNVLNANKHVTKREVLIMFKKYALNHKEVDFDTFQIMLEKVAIAFYKGEDGLSNIDAVEKFYQYLQVDNAAQFRQKQQLLNNPFNIQMKNGFRLLPFDQGREILLKKIDPVVKEKLKLRKEEKSQQMLFSSPQNNLLNPSRFGENSKSTPNFLASKDSQPNIFAPQNGQNYTSKKGKASITKIDQQSKISWQQLERLSFTDMKNLNRGLFKPSDLFNDNDDDEDRIYLAEYNLQEDKRKKIEQTLSNKRGQENYGQIKETLRPSQRFLLKQDPNYLPANQSALRYGTKNYQQNPSEYYSPQPERSTKQQSINQKYSERAMQIEKDQRSKERNLMQSIISSSDQKIQRGIQAANRNK